MQNTEKWTDLANPGVFSHNICVSKDSIICTELSNCRSHRNGNSELRLNGIESNNRYNDYLFKKRYSVIKKL